MILVTEDDHLMFSRYLMQQRKYCVRAAVVGMYRNGIKNQRRGLARFGQEPKNRHAQQEVNLLASSLRKDLRFAPITLDIPNFYGELLWVNCCGDVTARCNAWQPWADCVLEMRGKLPMNPILRPLKKLARFIQNPVEALNAIPLSLFGGESFLSSGYVSDF